MANNRILDIHEIASALGCSARTVRRLHAKGALKTFKINGPSSPIRMRLVDLKRVPLRKGKADV